MPGPRVAHGSFDRVEPCQKKGGEAAPGGVFPEEPVNGCRNLSDIGTECALAPRM